MTAQEIVSITVPQAAAAMRLLFEASDVLENVQEQTAEVCNCTDPLSEDGKLLDHYRLALVRTRQAVLDAQSKMPDMVWLAIVNATAGDREALELRAG